MTKTHRLFNYVSPFRRDSIFWVFLKESAQIFERWSKGSADLQKIKTAHVNMCETNKTGSKSFRQIYKFRMVKQLLLLKLCLIQKFYICS